MIKVEELFDKANWKKEGLLKDVDTSDREK